MIPQILMYLMIAIYFGSLWKIFEKAGRKSWEGFVPVYNILVWLKVIKKPWWWIFFFIIPFVNFVVAVGCNVETARLFGKYTPKDSLLCILLPWYYIPFLAFDKENELVEPTDWTKTEQRDRRFIHDHITLFFICPFVGHALLLIFKVIGSKDKPNKKTMACEWTNALGFAIVAASIIRTFFFEAFTIPTGSMEKTMRIGDYLFVNKMKYGAKLPQTPMSIPFVHNRIPGTFIPSFVEWFKLDYTRLPGYGEIKRNDIMVFNWPVGDSVIVHDAVIAHDYYGILRDEAFFRWINNLSVDPNTGRPQEMTYKAYAKDVDEYMNFTRNEFINGGPIFSKRIEKTEGITTLPIDKKENYIKRSVGVAGDTLQIINNIIHIDGVPEKLPPEALFTYKFYYNKNASIPPEQFLSDNYGMYYYNDLQNRQINKRPDEDIDGVKYIVYEYICSEATANKIKSKWNPKKVERENNLKGYDYAMQYQYCPIFPNHPDFNWTRDNFGPLYIPEKGGEIELNDSTWIIYKRAIEVYEQNEVKHVKGGPYFINGKEETSYTFKQNYYWLMGDNRHGSADSRVWGFVPEDHVVGTASFVWFSRHPDAEKGFFGSIRWDRVFSFVE